MSLRRQLMEQYDNELVFMDPASQFDSCIIGIGIGSRCGMPSVVVYDTDRVIKAYMSEGMDEDEAIEFFEFNAAESYVGEHTPFYVQRITSIN